MHVVLETERLLLRRFTAADVDNLLELDGDPEVVRHVGGRSTSRDDVEHDLLPAFMSYDERSDGFGFCAAVEKSSGDFLGWFHFRPPRGGSLDNVELGYRLRKVAWGKGYATEASSALVDRGFSELGVERVVAGAAAANVASWRIMEKLGMTRVRIDGVHVTEGEVEYALTRADWERAHAAP